MGPVSAARPGFRGWQAARNVAGELRPPSIPKLGKRTSCGRTAAYARRSETVNASAIAAHMAAVAAAA